MPENTDADILKAEFDLEAAREKHELQMQKMRADLEFAREQNAMKLQQIQREGMMKIAQKQAETFMEASAPAKEE